ncbi:MAG: lipoyl(octanoyl) transferase LipB [Ferrovum sp.]|nr:lipoyl(octanoyl) transferase LipB [Ferrovum sp.]
MVIRNTAGLAEYEPVWRAMQTFTRERNDHTPDELWSLQHPPVYTLGLAGKPEHLLKTPEIPVIKVDRGGQITYHGPGQIVVYLLVDLRRRHLTVKGLVRLMEEAVIEVLAAHGVVATLLPGAPGVYVGGAKIAALGLRVQRGCTYHGLSLNVDLDLAPFDCINPCGYAGMPVTRTRDLGISEPVAHLERQLLNQLTSRLEACCAMPS